MGTRSPTPLRTFTARELRNMEIPPQRWIIRDVIAEGLWMLASPPKTGKSWWVLGFLLSLASGGKAFGKIIVDRMEVLYLALEDTKARLRSRLEQLGIDETGWPATLHLLTEAPALDRGLAQSLRAWLTQHPQCRVVAIDTLARIRGPRIKTEDLYSGDSRVIADLQSLAKDFQLSLLLVHHTRKSVGADPFEEISGSYGITGPLDGMLVLKRTRGDADATLYITGRDVEDRELALQFDNHTGLWQLLGDAWLWELSKERRTILATIEAADAPLTPKEIATSGALNHASTKHLLIRMRNEGLLDSDGEGHYSVHHIHPTPEEASPTAQTPVNDTEGPHSPSFTNHPPVNRVNADSQRKPR